MNNKQLASHFFDNSIRAAVAIHVGTMCVDDAWPSIAVDAFDDYAEEIFAAVGVEQPDFLDKESLSEALVDARKLGWIVRFETPVPRNISDDGMSWSHSWGQYRTNWIYAETYEECCDKAMEWQEAYINECIAKDKEQGVDHAPSN